MFVSIVGILGKGGDELVTGFEGDRCDLPISIALRDIETRRDGPFEFHLAPWR
jgi:hypothetical protein